MQTAGVSIGRSILAIGGILRLIAALGFVAFLFWHLNLHYMNIIFAIRGYRVFTILPPQDDNPLSGWQSLVLITPRTGVLPGTRIIAYRLSDTVFFEAKGCQPRRFCSGNLHTWLGICANQFVHKRPHAWRQL
jgi:hypothetical protein